MTAGELETWLVTDELQAVDHNWGHDPLERK
jgi:hypothetical protein